ncbi:response regulator [Luteolibacter marinus]|uniref:response regulator n=1 Tax=Luteolibacter marinus TaxID=2776705 RepID=UPI00186926FB|nr:response regulator transcription factor [Luteolibacter marinus]
MESALIVEDLAEPREWLAGVVRTAFPGCRIHAAATLADGLRAVEMERFGLALIDLGLPDGSGFDLLRELQRSSPATRCVITTVMGDDAKIVTALAGGASGYLLKEQSAEQTVRQLVQLAEGMPILSPSIARRMIDHFRLTGPSETDGGTLTEREKETLALIARGYRNREVAGQLGVAESTVASHVKSIYRKLGIATRAEASWHATRLGL